MKRLDSFEDWEKAYSTDDRMSWLFSTLAVVTLFLFSLLVGLFVIYALVNHLFYVPYLFVGMGLMIVVLVSGYLSVVYGLPERSRGEWTKRLAKGDDAVKSFSIGVEYEADRLGLEPVNQIEFRRKQQ